MLPDTLILVISEAMIFAESSIKSQAASTSLSNSHLR